MTIYTDQVTGKEYDRVHVGMAGVAVPSEGDAGCHDCALYDDIAQCTRGIEHCVSKAPNKTVFFVFKERKA